MTTRIQSPAGIIPKIADAALASTYTLVKLKTTDPQRVQQSGSGEAIIGILQERTAAAAGDPVEVATEGFSQLRVDGSGTNIAAGDYIMAGASGLGVKLAGAAGTLRPIVGIAMAPSTAATDIITVKLALGVAQAA